MQTTTRTATFRRLAPVLVFALGAVLLAVEPMMWLVETWFEPTYDSSGGLVFLAVVALGAVSLTSGRIERERKRGAVLPYALLVLTAVVRIIGQVMAVNVIGALALVVDVYALGRLTGLHERRRPISPFWLSIAFAFALPLEQVLQRTVGFALQHVSAAGACRVIGAITEGSSCEGVRILVGGQDVQVDLPCSGARGLLLLLLTFTLMAAYLTPNIKAAAAGLTVTLLAAVGGNIARITILAMGIAYPDLVLGLDVMISPWHDLVGYLTLAMGAAPLILWARLVTKKSAPPRVAPPEHPRAPEPTEASRAPVAHLAWGGAVVVLALVVFVLPQRPIDVDGTTTQPPYLPSSLGDHYRLDVPLDPLEERYYTQFGGGATKARYGDHSLLVVETNAPLRHLHSPATCLTGAGHQVERVTVEHGVLPTAIYRSRAPDGTLYRVAVTYVSSEGQIATSVSEVTWRWLKDRDVRWRAVERIAPDHLPPQTHAAFDRAVAAAFDLPTHETTPTRTTRNAPLAQHEDSTP